jgi:hypothetical protein
MPEGRTASSFGRRLEAFAVGLLLFVVTLGIGWLVWSVVEWPNGRTPSYRILGLRVVRRSDEKVIGLGRSLVRSGICCPLLLLPTAVVCAVTGLCFALGASPPDELLSKPRAAPWDWMTGTTVIDERRPPLEDPKPGHKILDPTELSRAKVPPTYRQNGRAA